MIYISDIKDFAKAIKKGTFGLYAGTCTPLKMNKFPKGTTPSMRKATPENPYIGRVSTLSVYQNTCTGCSYYALVKSECEREGIHFSDEEFKAAFPSEKTYCEAEEKALDNIIMKHETTGQEYFRLYNSAGRKRTKVLSYVVLDGNVIEKDSDIYNDIMRYVPTLSGSKKQEALGVANIVKVRQPKIENVAFLIQGDKMYKNDDIDLMGLFEPDTLKGLFGK